MALARAVLAAVCRQRDMLEAAAAGPSANGKDDVYVSPRAGFSIVCRLVYYIRIYIYIYIYI
jgi:hypothetical protein